MLKLLLYKNQIVNDFLNQAHYVHDQISITFYSEHQEGCFWMQNRKETKNFLKLLDQEGIKYNLRKTTIVNKKGKRFRTISLIVKKLDINDQ